MLARPDARVEEGPELGPLLLRQPLAEAVAVREDPFFRARLFLVAPRAADFAAIVDETLRVTVSERGATRMDDRTSEASMERRKKEGYF